MVGNDCARGTNNPRYALLVHNGSEGTFRVSIRYKSAKETRLTGNGESGTW